MTSEASAVPRASTLLAVAAAVVSLLLAFLVLVLDRIGVPGGLLLGLVAGTGLLLVFVAGTSGGTMRLPIYLTGARSFGAASTGLGLATAMGLAASPGAALVQAAAVAAMAWSLGLVLRRSGAISLPGLLAARYGGVSLRALAALLVGACAAWLGAAEAARAARALTAATSLAPGAAALVMAVLALVAVVPGGGLGVGRAALAGGCLLVVAAVATLGLSAASGVGLPATAPDGSALLSLPPPLAAVGLAVLALAWPGLAAPAVGARDQADLREAGIWAAVAIVLVTLAAAALPAQAPAAGALAFAPACAAVLRILPPFLAGIALLHAAGVALGYDLPGRRDRLKISTSRRFADLRLVTLMLWAAGSFAAWRHAELLAQGTPVATTVIVAGLLPPLLLTLVRRKAGPGAGFAAMAAGLAAAALAADPRVWPDGVSLPPGLAGLAAGLLAGLALAWVVPPARPVPHAGDAAL